MIRKIINWFKEPIEPISFDYEVFKLTKEEKEMQIQVELINLYLHNKEYNKAKKIIGIMEGDSDVNSK